MGCGPCMSRQGHDGNTWRPSVPVPPTTSTVFFLTSVSPPRPSVEGASIIAAASDATTRRAG